MEIKESVVVEVLERLFEIFKKDDIMCSRFTSHGWIGIDLKEDFDKFVKAIYLKDESIYKEFLEIRDLIKVAIKFSRTKQIDVECLSFCLLMDEKEIEKEKVNIFRRFIELYEKEIKKTDCQFPKEDYIEEFYIYSQKYIKKDEKTNEILKNFKNKKLIIPEKMQILNLKSLKNYLTKSGKVTIKCRITDFNYITLNPEKLWKYYYLSLLTEEELLMKNQLSNIYEEINDLFIEKNN